MGNEKWVMGLFENMPDNTVVEDLYYQTDLLLKAREIDALNRINNNLSDLKAILRERKK